jgi:hypothetical protein
VPLPTISSSFFHRPYHHLHPQRKPEEYCWPGMLFSFLSIGLPSSYLTIQVCPSRSTRNRAANSSSNYAFTPCSPVSLQRGRPRSRVFASQVKRASSMQVRAPPPAHTLSATGAEGYTRGNLQLLAPEGTQRPVDPLTLHTSCFKLVFAVQQAPLGTGRPAFWGLGAATERKKARVNCIFAVLIWR